MRYIFFKVFHSTIKIIFFAHSWKINVFIMFSSLQRCTD